MMLYCYSLTDVGDVVVIIVIVVPAVAYSVLLCLCACVFVNCVRAEISKMETIKYMVTKQST